MKLRSLKSSELSNEKGDGPCRGFGYLSLFSDPIEHEAKENYCKFATFNRVVVTNNPNEAKILNVI